MSNQAIIDKLNDILRHEWTGVAQYAQAGFVIQGLWRVAYSKLFFESAEESFGHAKRIGEKIVALGGVPTVERNPIKQSDDLAEYVDASSGSRAKRGAMSVARFKIIGELVWDRVGGRQDGVWDNQAG